MMNTFTDRDLAHYREQKGVSRIDLCKKIGLPYRTLQNWENGKRKAPPYTIKMLKVTIDQMASENG